MIDHFQYITSLYVISNPYAQRNCNKLYRGSTLISQENGPSFLRHLRLYLIPQSWLLLLVYTWIIWSPWTTLLVRRGTVCYPLLSFLHHFWCGLSLDYQQKESMSSPTLSHPEVGTLIDEGGLEFVDVLKVGGFGVVYRAVDTISSSRRSYAVKCLTSVHGQSSTRRHLHIRETILHQFASAHPAIVTLHCVVEDHGHTYLIMDYAPDGDLFTQILHHRHYLGNDVLIKRVFLQILDAVQHCHSLGIYHCDLKPENVLCFDHGYRVAITDFGLATTKKLRAEFQISSVCYMSPGKIFWDSFKTYPYSCAI